mmetsp:Transcript_146897/g.469401  ORF Transcript_146897/g.469401 Transcript_146897/m.469401 type:complete len:211 (+) Transcript_146897:133-765(+)
MGWGDGAPLRPLGAQLHRQAAVPRRVLVPEHAERWMPMRKSQVEVLHIHVDNQLLSKPLLGLPQGPQTPVALDDVDVAVVAYPDQPQAAQCRGPLVRIRQPLDELRNALASLLSTAEEWVDLRLRVAQRADRHALLRPLRERAESAEQETEVGGRMLRSQLVAQRRVIVLASARALLASHQLGSTGPRDSETKCLLLGLLQRVSSLLRSA